MENNMNNGKNNNSYGIFYGVIGVATLIITIIGATFAYFTASDGSDDNAISAGGANVSLKFTGVENGPKVDLIPVNESHTNFKNLVGIGANECQDVNGNNICSVYSFSIANPAENTANMEVTAKIKPTQNGFTNLHMAIFKGDHTALDDNYNVLADIPDKPVTGTATCDLTICDWGDLPDGSVVFEDYQLPTGDHATDEISIDAMQQVLKIGESVNYTIVLWIHETGSEQNEDQGQSFKADIEFTTSAGDRQGITGVLAA